MKLTLVYKNIILKSVIGKEPLIKIIFSHGERYQITKRGEERIAMFHQTKLIPY